VSRGNWNADNISPGGAEEAPSPTIVKPISDMFFLSVFICVHPWPIRFLLGKKSKLATDEHG
jgi:hypothetical protein